MTVSESISWLIEHASISGSHAFVIISLEDQGMCVKVERTDQLASKWVLAYGTSLDEALRNVEDMLNLRLRDGTWVRSAPQ